MSIVTQTDLEGTSCHCEASMNKAVLLSPLPRAYGGGSFFKKPDIYTWLHITLWRMKQVESIKK